MLKNPEMFDVVEESLRNSGKLCNFDSRRQKYSYLE